MSAFLYRRYEEAIPDGNRHCASTILEACQRNSILCLYAHGGQLWFGYALAALRKWPARAGYPRFHGF